jgi:SAM-dependent methyltransferase
MLQHRIFNTDRLAGKRILDIGCGRHKLAGSVGLDHLAFPGVDVVSDLNHCLPFADDTFEVVHSNQVLEHIPNIIGLIHEIHRVVVPGGIVVAHVPYFRSSWAAIDPTHVRQFTLNSLDYFVRGTYFFEGYRFSDTSFSRVERFLDGTDPPSLFRLVFTELARKWPSRFENSVLSFIYPFQLLTLVLTK